MKSKIGIHLMIIIMFVILLAGCANGTDIKYLAGTETCRPPCWMGIQPGVTSFDDTVKILAEYEMEGDGDYTVLDSGIIRWQSEEGKNVYFYIADNALVSITDLRPSSTKFEDIIATFGEPGYLDIGKVRDGYFSATFFYPEDGLAFVASSGDASGYPGFAIHPEMNVVKAVFYQPAHISDIVKLLYGENAVSRALLDMQEWNGFGIYYE